MRTASFVLLLFVTFSNAFGAETAAPAAPASRGGLNLWELLVQGGWAMWPLGLCSLVAFALAIHGARETKRGRFIPDALVPPLEGLLGQRDLPQASAMLGQSPTVLSRVLVPALTRARPEVSDAAKERVEESLAAGLEHEETVIGQWVNYLNVVATVAPMIGLLGTVSGMIGAFQTISSGGMGRPELLAGDIGEALITTATGLVIGIPAMIAYFVMRNRLGNQVMATAQVATRLIDALADGSTTKPVEPSAT